MTPGVEEAFWVDWRAPALRLPSGRRAYFGHETCEGALPPIAAARELALRLGGEGRALSLVAPFLTPAGLESALRLVDAVREVDGGLEVVCGDWGLLSRLAREGGLALAVARTLAAQPADPRLLRMLPPARQADPGRRIRHLDGTEARLRRRPPSPELLAHHRSTWLDRDEVVAWLRSLGVSRAELSNVGQGLAVGRRPGWSWSLHLPWVLVSAMRGCPDPGERIRLSASCPPGACRPSPVAWRCAGLPVELVRRDNALYYQWTALPADLGAMSIDRLVNDQAD